MATVATTTPDPSTRIATQIERTAGAYDPQVYSVLTQCHDFERNIDAMAAEFIPLTQVKTQRVGPAGSGLSGGGLDTQSKLMVFGVLPPTALVSGRMLDRSANIPATKPYSEVVQKVGIPNSLAAIGAADPRFQSEKAHKGAEASCRAALEGMFGSTTDGEVRMLMALAHFETKYGTALKPGSFNYGSIHDGNGWKGDTFEHKDTRPTKDGGTEVYITKFRKYPDAKAGWTDLALHVYVVRKRGDARAAAAAGGIDQFAALLYDTGYYQSRGKDRESRIANYLAGLTTGVEAANAVLGTTSTPVTQEVPWQKQGAQLAADQKARDAVVADTDYQSRVLGNAYMPKQRQQAQQAQKAIEDMRNTPPLRLLVNPHQWSLSHEKVLTDSDRSRRGPIVQIWGAGQPKISATGKVPGFFSIDAANAEAPGLTRHARNYSAGWQNFQALYQIYRNNGRVWLDDTLGGSGAKNLSLVGSVYIYYDNILYIGSFDTLNVTEDDKAPFTAEYQFDFTIRALFLLDRPISSNLAQGDVSFLRGGALPGSGQG